MSPILRMAAVCAFAFSGLLASDELPPETQAKFVKILANNAGAAGKVGCTSAALGENLVKLGLTVDAGSKVAWAASLGEVKSLKGAGKLVICGKLEWLQSGGAIAIVLEGNKPQIYLHMGNIAASGASLSDAVLKIGKKL